MVKILLGGSPCTHWSIAQSKNRETQAEGIGWELFENYRIARDRFRPDLFLYENNQSAAKAIKDQISTELGVPLFHLNSALVSAQSRDRFYAFNWTVSPPEDLGLSMCDVLTEEDFVPYNGGAFIRTKPDLLGKLDRPWQIGKTSPGGGQAVRVYDLKGKSVTLKSQAGGGGAKTGLYLTAGGVMALSASGAAKLQTMPVDYCRAVSNSKAITALGNGWTADIICHILSAALDHVPRDEELVVLSMYDGIATGRYCLDKLGFANVTYFAYEIDQAAISVAKDNYPDIISLGDAFDVRRPDWFLSAGEDWML